MQPFRPTILTAAVVGALGALPSPARALPAGPCVKDGAATAAKTSADCLAQGGTWVVDNGGDRVSTPLFMGGDQVLARGGRSTLDAGQFPSGQGESGDAQNLRSVAGSSQATVPLQQRAMPGLGTQGSVAHDTPSQENASPGGSGGTLGAQPSGAVGGGGSSGGMAGGTTGTSGSAVTGGEPGVSGSNATGAVGSTGGPSQASAPRGVPGTNGPAAGQAAGQGDLGATGERRTTAPAQPGAYDGTGHTGDSRGQGGVGGVGSDKGGGGTPGSSQGVSSGQTDSRPGNDKAKGAGH